MRRYCVICLSVLATAFASAAVAESPLLVPLTISVDSRTESHSDFIRTSFSDVSDATGTDLEGSGSYDLEQRVQQLESELEQLKRRPTADPLWSLERRLQQQEAGSGGLFGSIEVTFLKPHITGAQAAFGLGAVGRLINPDFEPGMRYILGYQGDSGIGVRGQYWSYDQTSSYVPTFAPATLGIRLDAADAEITLDQKFRHWDVQLSGGLRYGRLEYSNPLATIFGVGSVTFEGIGPTASLGGRRAIGNTGLSIFSSVRGSVMVGEVRNGALLTFMPAVTLKDEVMTVAENQLGIAWTTAVTRGSTLELKTAWETQYWMNSTLSDDVYGIGSNLGFMGPTISVELKY